MLQMHRLTLCLISFNKSWCRYLSNCCPVHVYQREGWHSAKHDGLFGMQLLAFEDMGVRVEELMQYAAAEEEVPFAHPVTKFPVSKKPTLPPTFADKKEVRCACRFMLFNAV